MERPAGFRRRTSLRTYMVPYMSKIQRRWHDLLSIALQMHGFQVLWPCFATLGDTATWWQSEPCRRLQPKGRHPEVFQHTWVDSTLDDSINAVGLDPASSARAEMMKDNPPFTNRHPAASPGTGYFELRQRLRGLCCSQRTPGELLSWSRSKASAHLATVRVTHDRKGLGVLP